MIKEKNRHGKTWVDKGREFAGELTKLFKAEGIQIYSTVSETKAAFAECTIRSVKNIRYRYMEGYGYNYVHKLTPAVTILNSRRNCPTDLIQKNVRSSEFLSDLYSKPLREFKKPKFKNGDKVRISKFDLPFRNGYKPQFTHQIFEIVAVSSRKPPTYTLKMNRLSVVIFIKKS